MLTRLPELISLAILHETLAILHFSPPISLAILHETLAEFLFLLTFT